ncbi:hypothetical protein F4604DRAFT_1673154 [Suillus subluteus]|nr:hypothetical protein F4604DRAFT_1673154 [Suillus subluteus]
MCAGILGCTPGLASFGGWVDNSGLRGWGRNIHGCSGTGTALRVGARLGMGGALFGTGEVALEDENGETVHGGAGIGEETREGKGAGKATQERGHGGGDTAQNTGDIGVSGRRMIRGKRASTGHFINGSGEWFLRTGTSQVQNQCFCQYHLKRYIVEDERTVDFLTVCEVLSWAACCWYLEVLNRNTPEFEQVHVWCSGPQNATPA